MLLHYFAPFKSFESVIFSKVFLKVNQEAKVVRTLEKCNEKKKTFSFHMQM